MGARVWGMARAPEGEKAGFMGCDIHLAVERRENGRWVRVLPPPEIYDPWLKEQADKGVGDYYTQRVAVTWYNDRNYDLFGMLANVRNGSGFAGCDTGNGFLPISEPRGFPDDLSEGVKRLLSDERDEDDNDIWMGDHSHSWLTLRELLDYNWDWQSVRRGWVDPWNFELFRRNGAPNSWCGGVSGGSTEHISNHQMAKLIDSGEIQWDGDEPSADSHDQRAYTTSLGRRMQAMQMPIGSVGAAIAQGLKYYTQIEWPISYSKAAGRFYAEVLPALQALGSPDDVRIVFGFDS